MSQQKAFTNRVPVLTKRPRELACPFSVRRHLYSFLAAVTKYLDDLDDGNFLKRKELSWSQFKATVLCGNRSLRPLVTLHPWSGSRETQNGCWCSPHFSFLYSPRSQPVERGHLHTDESSHLYQPKLQTPSQICSKTCLQGDPRSLEIQPNHLAICGRKWGLPIHRLCQLLGPGLPTSGM